MSARILVPHDFSPCADAALAEALVDAKLRPGSELILVHVAAVMAPPPASVDFVVHSGSAQLDLERRLIQEAQEQLERIADALRKTSEGLHVQTNVVTASSVSDAILGEVKHKRATRVVMGTHGKRGLAHLLLGSVAERVVRDAPIPVLVVKATN